MPLERGSESSDAIAPADGALVGAPSAARLILRLMVGGTILAVEDAERALRHLAAGAAPDGILAEPLPAPSARHVLIGALATGPARLSALLQRGQRVVARPAKLASHGLRAVARVVPRVVPNEALTRRANRLRARALTTARRLAEVGRREEQEGRALARAAVADALTDVLDVVADSPQLQTVIREQSAGMGRSALGELRERSARADTLVESVLGHLLPRHKPSNGHGSGTP
jgi:hypothetical protein